MSTKSAESLTDEQLMEKYQMGDVEAFEILYHRHSGRVYGFLQKKIPAAAAQEVLQEIYFKIHRSREQYSSKYPFLPWLFTIARNALIDYQRRGESKIAKFSSEALLESMPAKESDLINLRERADLSLALEGLSDQQKRVIEMRYQNDWSFEKIAEELGTSTENSRQLVSRALRKVKALLAGGLK